MPRATTGAAAFALPDYWVDQLISQDGWARAGNLRYGQANELARQTEAYFAQPVAAKLGDARPREVEAGYGQGASCREWLFVRDTDVPEQLAVQLSALWTWCHALSLACMSRVAAHLGLPERAYLSLVEASCEVPAQRNDSLLRLFHYAGSPLGEQRAQVVTGAHQDIGLLAIGLRTAPGLQVSERDASSWKHVENGLDVGEVVVMAGDSLAAVTNRQVPSCRHRVISGVDERYSWVYHLRLKNDALLDVQQLTSAKTGAFPPSAVPCLGGAVTGYLFRTKVSANAPLPLPSP